MKMINPQLIKCDRSIHSRAELVEEIITDYEEDMKKGDEFPPILVYWDGTKEEYILVDGFHRYYAWQRINPTGYIPAKLKLGTEDDARWGAICANKDHGLRRSNADKRRAVELALLHPKGAKLSNRLIAKFTGVSYETVRSIRQELESTDKLCQSTLRQGADGRLIDTTNIGDIPLDRSEKTCHECHHYRNGRCLYSGDLKEPEVPACEEFRQLEVKREQPVPDRSNIKILENWGVRDPVTTNENHCRKPGSMQVHVYEDNPTLSAVELRHILGSDWLAELYAAIHQMLIDDAQDAIKN